jgi:hypothetical protein
MGGNNAPVKRVYRGIHGALLIVMRIYLSGPALLLCGAARTAPGFGCTRGVSLGM